MDSVANQGIEPDLGMTCPADLRSVRDHGGGYLVAFAHRPLSGLSAYRREFLCGEL